MGKNCKFSIAKGTEGTLSSHASQEDPDEEASQCDAPAFPKDGNESESDVGTEPKELSASIPGMQAMCLSHSEALVGVDTSADVFLDGDLAADRECANLTPKLLRCVPDCVTSYDEWGTAPSVRWPPEFSALPCERAVPRGLSTGVVFSERKRRRFDASENSAEEIDKENELRSGRRPIGLTFVKRP